MLKPPFPSVPPPSDPFDANALIETLPVGVPVVALTFTVAVTGLPCVIVMGDNERLVEVERKVELLQLLTRFAALTLPRPLARS